MFKLNKHNWGIINSLKEKLVKSYTHFFGSKISNILDKKEFKSKTIYFDNIEYILENGKLFKIENWQKELIEIRDSKWIKITNMDDIQLLEWNPVASIIVKSINWKSYMFNRSFEQISDTCNANYEFENIIEENITSTISFGKYNLAFWQNFYYLLDYNSDRNKKYFLKDEYWNEIISKNVFRMDNNIYILSNKNNIYKFRYWETWLKEINTNEYLNFVNSDNQISKIFTSNSELYTFQDKKTGEFHKKSIDKKLLIWKWYIKEEINNSRVTNFYLTKSSNLWELDNIEINFPKDEEIAPILNLSFNSGARFELTFWNIAEYLLFFNHVKSDFNFEFKNNLDPISKIKALKDSKWIVYKNKFCWVIDINTFENINNVDYIENYEINDNVSLNQTVNNIVWYTNITKDKLLDKLEKLEIEKELNNQRIKQNHEFIITNEKKLLEFLKSKWKFLLPYEWYDLIWKWFIRELQINKEDLEKSIKELKRISKELFNKNLQLDNEISLILSNINDINNKDKFYNSKNDLKILNDNIKLYKKKISLSLKQSDKIMRSVKLRELENDYNLKLLLFKDSLYTDSKNYKYDKEIKLLSWKLKILEQELVNLQNNKVEIKWENIDTYNSLSLTKIQLTNTKLYNWSEYYFEINYKNSSEVDFPARLKVHYKYKWANEFMFSKDYLVVNYEHSDKVYRWLEKVTKTMIDIRNIKDKLKDIK